MIFGAPQKRIVFNIVCMYIQCITCKFVDSLNTFYAFCNIYIGNFPRLLSTKTVFTKIGISTKIFEKTYRKSYF